MKACRECRYVFSEGDKCPVCGSESVTDKYYGAIYIVDTEHSEIAKLIGARTPGKYAVKVK